MGYDWNDGHMIPFLESYRKHECLWNPGSGDYFNNVARDRACMAIIMDLALPGLTLTDVQAKIKSTRIRYGMELKKILDSEQSGAGLDDVYKPRLFGIAMRRSTSNLEVSKYDGARYWFP